MSKVVVRESHSKSAADVKAGISTFEEMLAKYMVKVEWSGYTAKLSGPVSGAIQITDEYVEVNLKLGMMAKMAGIDPVKLESSIRKRLRSGLA